MWSIIYEYVRHQRLDVYISAYALNSVTFGFLLALLSVQRKRRMLLQLMSTIRIFKTKLKIDNVFFYCSS